MGLDWDKLVEERNAWVAHNFPDPDGKRTPLDSVLGCIEELGELTHAHLKQVQSIRGSDEEHVANAKDAIGDLTVYLLGVMSAKDVRPTYALPIRKDGYYNSDKIILWLTIRVGSLASLQADSDRHRTKWSPVVSSICVYSDLYCQSRKWDYEQIVKDTWDEVKQRDWVKYPDTGLRPLENLDTLDDELCRCPSSTVTAVECPIHGW